MYNKKVLIDSLKNLGSAKAPVKRQDVMVDPSGNPMMKNGGLNEKPYKKVSVQKSNIQGKGLFADEPIRAGEIIGLSHIKSSFQKDGQTYLKSKETPVIGTYYNHSDDNFNAGSIIQGNKRYLRALKNIQPGEEIAGNYYEDNDPTLESPDDFKKGGSLPKMPRKKNSRGYSRSLEATNKFFTENSFFAKPKSRKNKVYDPNAKYYQDGGITSQEEIDAANRAMMKARLAYANMHGNPAAQRMIVAPDQPYQFDNGMIGTHYMASMDDYAVPQIQDVNGQLMLGDYGPDSMEAIKFDNPEDAQYFAENYKNVSPAFLNEKARLNPTYYQLGDESGPWNPDYEQPSTFEFKPLSPEEIAERTLKQEEEKRRIEEEKFIEEQATWTPEQWADYKKAEKVKAYQKALINEPQYFKEGIQFVTDWHNSPMYNQMVLNSYKGDQKSADYITKLRKQNIASIPDLNIVNSEKTKYGANAPMAWSFSDSGQIEVFPGGFESGPSTYVHEGLHSSDRPRGSFKGSGTNYPSWMLYKDPRFPNEDVWFDRTIPVSDQKYITKNRSANYKDSEAYNISLKENPNNFKVPGDEEIKNEILAEGVSPDDPTFQTIFNTYKKWYNDDVKNYTKGWKENWKEYGHDYVSQPTEVRARLGEFRYYANKAGIYDPFTQELSPENYQKFINTFKDNKNQDAIRSVNDLREQFTDEEIMWMLNNISKNNESTEELDVAAEGGSLELELTPQEIEEYAKGGFIIEDISVPQLTKANLGKVVKTVTKAPPVRRYAGTIIGPAGVSRTVFPRGTTTVLPKINPTQIDLKNIPADLKALQINYPLSISGDTGYLSVHPNNKVEDNVFHFSTKMTSPLEAGKAFKIANDAFPQPFPSILEPHSLSLDSYNLLLNMANKKDWTMNFENHIPLNFAATHSKLFEGLDNVPRGLRSVRQWDPKAAEEMISRLNADLQGRGLTEQAYLQLIPGSNTGEIRIPNYKLTRKYNLGGVAKVVPPKLGLVVSSNLIKSLRGLGTVSKNLPALNYVADNYLKGLSNELNLPAAIPGVQFELPKLDLQQTKKLLEKVPMLESDFLTQYSGYNPIMYEGNQPIITGGLTGHKTSFENFDRSFRGSGLGNQEGGAYFTPHPDFAASAARSSSLGGYGLIPQSKTFTPYVSEALFKNPQNFLNYNAPMTNEFIKKVGLINGVDPRNFQNGYEYEQALRTSFNPTGNEDLIRTSQAQAADALRDKGFTGAFDPREITVFDESDVKKIKQQELYKDLDDALIMSYLNAASKNQEQQSDVEKKLVKSFEEYLTTGNKQKLIDAERKYGGALNQRRNGGPAPVEMDTPIEENDPSSTLIDANSYFSNWYGNRQLPFDEIGNKTYERTLKQFLPAYNPQSPLLDELNQSVPYEYTNIINNDPTVMGELVYDDEGDAAKILLNEKLKANPKELNSTIAHEERTRLWDKFGDKILPAEQIIIQPNLKSFEEGWGDLKGADKKQAREYYDYLTDPSQDNIQSLIFEVRQSKGLQPTQVITEDDIKSWKSEAEKSGALDMNSPSYDPALYNLFKVVKDEKGLKDLFNYIAKNDSEEEMQYAQQGGSIDYELGDEIDEATMQQLKKLGYTFEKI